MCKKHSNAQLVDVTQISKIEKNVKTKLEFSVKKNPTNFKTCHNDDFTDALKNILFLIFLPDIEGAAISQKQIKPL